MTISFELVRNIAYTRYVINLLSIAFFSAGFPLPVPAAPFIYCGIATLVLNAVSHGILLATRRCLLPTVMMMVSDSMLLLAASFFSGMIGSPLLVVLPLTLMSAYSATSSRKIAIGFGIGFVAAYIIAVSIWWATGYSSISWKAHDYPLFTLALAAIQLAALLGYIFLSIRLPDPLMAKVAEGDRKIGDLQRRAELGASLTMVAHEISNLLTVVVGNLELMKKEAESPGREAIRQGTDKARKAARHMTRLVGAVKSYARERKGNYYFATHEARDLAGQAIELVELKYRHLPVEIQVNENPGGTSLVCDGDAIFQVLVNLIDNAIKARRDGHAARIAIEIVEDGGVVRFVVRDNGRGIPRENLGRIFDDFFTDRPTGTGVGLFLCRSLVEDHGGKITASSVPGEGTTMSVELPCSGPGKGK